jgi:anti-sigma regulatory factor (Ser/Thr protein kinase)
MSSKHKLTVTGDFNNLARIADFINEIAVQAGLDDKACYAVQMAVDEACTNVIEHAYGGEGKGKIQLDCQIQAEGLQVTIIDRGIPFDPEQIPPLNTKAPITERSRRGMGVFFIHKLMDRVEYKFNTSQGNQLILFKRRT